jgi:hypothetical protein
VEGLRRPFLGDFLGASSITVLDASSYEGADTIHDMNTPVPEVWHGRYDVVIDSGSLEHIFNFSVAIANLANMLRVGGTIFVTTPANNLMGHGFYQFSPELMFRVFSEPNGFAVHKILLVEAGYPSVELTRNHTVYEVTDPKHVRERVGLISKKPGMKMVEATKTRDGNIPRSPWTKRGLSALKLHSATEVNRNTLQNEPSTRSVPTSEHTTLERTRPREFSITTVASKARPRS